MTAADLLRELEGAGVRLQADGDKLRVRAPRGALTPVLRTALQARKVEIVAALQARTGGHLVRAALEAGAVPVRRELGRCFTCGGRRWWRRAAAAGGGWTCRTCHPPANPALVAEEAVGR